jgi:hypothetical protein
MSLEDAHSKRITLNVDVAEVRDLLLRVPRACLAFAGDDGPQVEPVSVDFRDDHYLVGMPSGIASHLKFHDEAVLLVDDGVQFFDLRAVYVRGGVQPRGQLTALARDLVWFEVEPSRTVAWDYRRIRREDDEL